MMDSERAAGVAQEPQVDPSEEAAASKLWAVYVSEAEKYDKSLVESWKSDMEGMLIFAGLFSASLTAFIIESYKTLSPDSGNSTVQLLTQISQQMAASANGTAFIPPPAVHFAPSAAAIVCNAMWFLSLGLSLACALIATLLEQWARDFLHRSEMRSSPAIRARIFSYLYYGLKRFNMHAVVDVIPLLLHASLVLFFAGLVAFLLPINLRIAMVAAFILALVLIVYLGLTLLPLFSLDCPYRTPLSAVCWKFLHSLRMRWRRKTPDSAPIASKTIAEAIETQARVADPARDERDARALTWTVKSLADNTELEPFVEAIPDVLWGPGSLRHSYQDHIHLLARDPQLQLLPRIQALLHSCKDGLLAPQASRRRAITCYKAFWAIASIQSAPPSSVSSFSPVPHGFQHSYPPSTSPQRYLEALDFSPFVYMHHRDGGDELRQYLASAIALMQWSTFSFHCRPLTALVAKSRAGMANEGDVVPDMQPLLSWLDRTWGHFGFGIPMEIPSPLPGDLPGMTKLVDDVLTLIPYKIVFQYLLDLPAVDSAPYRWRETRERILPASAQQSVPFSALKLELEYTLFVLISRRLSLQTDENIFGWLDGQIYWLYSLWPNDGFTSIPLSILRYWIAHSSLIIAHDWPRKFTHQLWLAFAITVSDGPTGPDPIPPHVDSALDPGTLPVLKALWILVSSWEFTPSNLQFEPLLAAVQSVPPPHRQLASSIQVMLEMRLLFELHRFKPTDEIAAAHLEHPLLQLETSATIIPPHDSFELSAPRTALYNRIVEAQISVVAKFIGDYCSESPPLDAVIAHQRATSYMVPPRGPVHSTHQIRFAQNSHMLHTSAHGPEFFDALVNCRIFDIYAETIDHDDRWYALPAPRYAWLDDETARIQLRDLFQQNMGNATLWKQTRSRLETIILNLDALHNGSSKL